jgi:hypothetical protein
MTDFFKSLSKCIKARGARLKSEKRVVWLSKSAAIAVRVGKVKVPEQWRQAAEKQFSPD